jgi:hypothetical protein
MGISRACGVCLRDRIAVRLVRFDQSPDCNAEYATADDLAARAEICWQCYLRGFVGIYVEETTNA